MEIVSKGELKTGFAHIDRPWMQYYNIDGYEKVNTNQSIVDYMVEKTKAHKSKVAINYFGEKVKYGKLMKKINKAAHILKLMGVSKDDRIMYMMPNIPETAYFMYGASKIGAVSDFIDPRPDSVDLEVSAKKILQLATKEHVKYIIALDQCYLGMVKPIEEQLKESGVERILVVSASDSLGLKGKLNYIKEVIDFKGKEQLKPQLEKTKKFGELLKQTLGNTIIPTDKYLDLLKLSSDEEIKSIEFEPNKLSVIVHTSGTTSAMPKGIPLTNENLNEYVEQTEIANMPMAPKDKALHILPYFAAFGLAGVVHGGLGHSCELIQIPEFEPSNLGKMILKHKSEIIIGPPTWFLNLINDPVLNGADLSFIKMITYGGDSMEPADEIRINEFFKAHNCDAKITKGHGLSETCGCASYATGEYNKLGSMGIPMPNSIYTIVDFETKEPKKFSDDIDFIEGEIAISSPTMTSGILDGVEVAQTMLINGQKYLLTKDIARMYKDGTLYFLSRSDRSFMRFDGFKVKPYEIEKIIKDDIKVKYCVVTPCFDSAKMGNIIQATIVLEDGIVMDVNEQKEFVEHLIEQYFISNPEVSSRQIPAKFSFRESMPLTSMSKVDYNQICKEGLNGSEITVELEETNISVGEIVVKAPEISRLIKK